MRAGLRNLVLSSRSVNHESQAADSACFGHLSDPAHKMEVTTHTSLHRPIFLAAVSGTSLDIADINKYLLN